MTSPFRDLGFVAGRETRPRWGRGFLSAIVPGLGQLVGGRIRTGLMFLAPIVVLLVAAIVAALVNGPLTVAAWFADPAVLGGLLIVEAAILVWRILTVVSSLEVRRVRWRVRDAVPAAVLAIVVMAPQLLAGTLTAAARQAAENVFSGSTDGSGVWQPSTAPAASAGAVQPSPTASSSPGASSPVAPGPSGAPIAGGRITVLLLGVDRSPEVTDTMIVASLDTVGKTVSMLSIPATRSMCRCRTGRCTGASSTR